jgi:hypothetical protein
VRDFDLLDCVELSNVQSRVTENNLNPPLKYMKYNEVVRKGTQAK